MGSSQKVAQERRIRFSQGIHAGLNQREALRQAGYKASDKSLDEMGPRLMKHPEVQAHLAKLRAAGDAKAIADREELLKGLTADWRRDLGPYMRFTEEGLYRGLDLKKLVADGKGHWIEELIFEESKILEAAAGPDAEPFQVPAQKVKVKFTSRHGAADRIAKLLGLNAPDKHVVASDEAALRKMLAGLSDEELAKLESKT